MTAPRSCRSCGAALPSRVRWCLQCYEPIGELTARPPLWTPGEFVDNPIHQGGGEIPHWSRWEKSATTLGPVGRVSATVVTVLWLLSAATNGPLTLVFVVPAVGVILRGIWFKGWVVPGEATPAPPREPISSWFWDRSEFVGALTLAIFALLGIGLRMYSADRIVRFTMVTTAVVVGCLTLFRRVGK